MIENILHFVRGGKAGLKAAPASKSPHAAAAGGDKAGSPEGAEGAQNSPSAAAYYTELAVDVLARTLWGEARGEGPVGMEAVANVIANRVAIAQGNGKYWWGNDIISVCQKPYQFSCWNRSDLNYRKLLEIGEKDIHFATALRIARRAVAGSLPDMTKGATHYHANHVTPYWARGVTPVLYLGRHVFYRLV